MLTLKEWIELVDYKITEGSDYYLSGFTDLYSLSSWNHDPKGHSFSIVFSPVDNQRVYIVEACDYRNNLAYRLVSPELHNSLDAQENWKQAWDDIEWIDLECDDDFIQKVLGIKSGEDYDTRIKVAVDIPNDELFKYMLLAHERDITLNQLIEQAINHELVERKL